MTIKIPEWKETVAIAGVILSLLFVAYEIRQNTQVVRAQARHELAALNQQWPTLLSQDSTINSIFFKVWADMDAELTESEMSRATAMMTLNLRRLENVYFQYSEGLVDEAALRSYGGQLSTLYKSPRFKKYWMADNWRI